MIRSGRDGTRAGRPRARRPGAARRRGRACALALATLALAACEPAQVERRATPPLTVAPAAAPGPAAAAAPSARGMIDLVNAERRARGLAPLRLDRRLDAAATGHAADMGTAGFFNHRGSDGGTHADRIAARGFRACLAGENIAWGQRSVGEVVRGWLGSAGHARVMLHPRATAFGGGFHPSRRQWVMVVARPC